MTIVSRLKAEEGIDGLILGGTELPLLLREIEDQGVPFLDTTKLHVEQVVVQLLQANSYKGFRLFHSSGKLIF